MSATTEELQRMEDEWSEASEAQRRAARELAHATEEHAQATARADALYMKLRRAEKAAGLP